VASVALPKKVKAMISLVTCVEYDDFLTITLPWAVPHFSRTFVLTTPDDHATAEVAIRGGAELIRTDAFHRHGDHFNKGRAIDEALVRLADQEWTGWCCLWDADIVFPAQADFGAATDVESLYTPTARRDCGRALDFTGQADWSFWPLMFQNRKYDAGFCQVFHRVALAKPPYYPRDWAHAGVSDTVFADKWPEEKRKFIPMEVLHLGERGRNWHGRSTQRIDGTMPHLADQRREWMENMWRTRRKHASEIPRTAPAELRFSRERSGRAEPDEAVETGRSLAR
jgi:hypothetical protein